MADYELFHDEQNKRYEFHIGEHKPYIDYSVNDKGEVCLNHTIVPPALEGQGIAGAMTEKVLGDIEKRGMKVKPHCSYSVAYIKRHPQWERLLNN